MKKIKIGNKLIGEGESCFIIAEAGVNHNGDIKLAKKLVDVAKEAGADSVKFQTFKAERLVTYNARQAEYQIKNIGKKESQYEMLKRLELSSSDFKKLKEYCDYKGIIFLSSPFDEESADLLENIGIVAFKLGSGEITNSPLLKHVAKKKLPIILSTGYSTMQEVEEAVKIIEKQGNKKIILLHCTSDYPLRLENVNLLAMKTMMDRFKYPVGYSDHTLGLTVPIAAVALGAKVIEKHFTLDRELPGPDHRASATPEELKLFVENIKDVLKLLGSSIKNPTKSEAQCIRLGRKSIVARTDIKKSSKINKDMLIIKRPGTGIYPRYLDKIIGRVAKRDIPKDAIIKWEMIS
jgi:N-acetylneuraminate synthase/N,N'-diacetyllegionaminate synthase